MNNQCATRRWLGISLSALAIALSLFWLEPSAVRATPASVITVNTLTDEDVANGNCSLREAIIAANTNASYNGCAYSGTDSIAFSLAGTITLSSTLPTITDSLTINGHSGGTTISGSNLYRVLEIFDGNFSPPGPVVNLSDLTIANANSGGGGGGIWGVDQILMITNTTFISNSAPGNVGGAITSSGGFVTVTTSAFTNNSASDGGAISSCGTQVSILRSAFSGNRATRWGGAVDYSCGGGWGFIIVNSTLYSNTAVSGGALRNASITSLVNSTIAGNSSITSTGGLTNTGGTISFYNTIVANNIGGNCGKASGILSDSGYNLDSGTTCGFVASGSLSNINPLLAAFGNYGGRTKTMPPLPGSPAINAGSDAICADTGLFGASGLDQRGTVRPYGAHCDMGAVEAVYSFLPLILR